MERVLVVKQSEAILSDPSGYWISVINVGRLFHLNDIREVDEANATAGQVISTMMHVGDVLAANPATICCSPSQETAHQLAVRYYSEAQVKDIAPPRIHCIADVDTTLQRVVAGGGQQSPDRDYNMSDNLASGAGKKINKAFCAPTDIEYNPPLRLAINVALGLFGSLQISEETTYTNSMLDKSYAELTEHGAARDAAVMREEFEADRLTPQTLKPPLKKIMDGMLNAIQAKWKANCNDDMKRIKKLAATTAKKAKGKKA